MLVLSADYQMSKLVPFWGFSPQPGSTSYLQKLTHDVYSIVNEATGVSAVYLLDKSRCVHLFLDNTCSTNKNFYLIGWAWKMVLQGVLDFFRASFLIAGHTKFRPDMLFSKTYSTSDVFTTAELKDIVIARSADVTVDKGSIIEW